MLNHIANNIRDFIGNKKKMVWIIDMQFLNLITIHLMYVPYCNQILTSDMSIISLAAKFWILFLSFVFWARERCGYKLQFPDMDGLHRDRHIYNSKTSSLFWNIPCPSQWPRHCHHVMMWDWILYTAPVLYNTFNVTRKALVIK